MNSAKTYEPPIINIIEIAVEQGFAISNEMGSNITDWNNENIEGDAI